MIRLLNIYTLQQRQFDDDKPPRYIITSHRWTKDELTLQDYNDSDRAESPGYFKLDGFCRFVQASGSEIEWLWIDTCCIDKTNSEEVAEAITSMFRWYQKAECCVAYLHDVRSSNSGDFLRSEWFERGWTLQELVAPRTVLFLDEDWKLFGCKGSQPEWLQEAHDQPMDSTKDVFHATDGNIPLKVLYNPDECQNIPSIDKWQWTTGRKTTRKEDMAYCLIGIFGVSLIKNYGEGDEAMVRLKHAIAVKEGADLKPSKKKVRVVVPVPVPPKVIKDQWSQWRDNGESIVTRVNGLRDTPSTRNDHTSSNPPYSANQHDQRYDSFTTDGSTLPKQDRLANERLQHSIPERRNERITGQETHPKGHGHEYSKRNIHGRSSIDHSELSRGTFSEGRASLHPGNTLGSNRGTVASFAYEDRRRERKEQEVQKQKDDQRKKEQQAKEQLERQQQESKERERREQELRIRDRERERKERAAWREREAEKVENLMKENKNQDRSQRAREEERVKDLKLKQEQENRTRREQERRIQARRASGASSSDGESSPGGDERRNDRQQASALALLRNRAYQQLRQRWGHEVMSALALVTGRDTDRDVVLNHEGGLEQRNITPASQQPRELRLSACSKNENVSSSDEPNDSKGAGEDVVSGGQSDANSLYGSPKGRSEPSNAPTRSREGKEVIDSSPRIMHKSAPGELPERSRCQNRGLPSQMIPPGPDKTEMRETAPDDSSSGAPKVQQGPIHHATTSNVPIDSTAACCKDLEAARLLNKSTLRGQIRLGSNFMSLMLAKRALISLFSGGHRASHLQLIEQLTSMQGYRSANDGDTLLWVIALAQNGRLHEAMHITYTLSSYRDLRKKIIPADHGDVIYVRAVLAMRLGGFDNAREILQSLLFELEGNNKGWDSAAGQISQPPAPLWTWDPSRKSYYSVDLLLDEYVHSDGQSVPLKWGTASSASQSVETRGISDMDDKYLRIVRKDSVLAYWDSRRSAYFHFDIGSYQAQYPIFSAIAEGDKASHQPERDNAIVSIGRSLESRAARNPLSDGTLNQIRAAYGRLRASGTARQEVIDTLTQALVSQRPDIRIIEARSMIMSALGSLHPSVRAMESDDQDDDRESEEE